MEFDKISRIFSKTILRLSLGVVLGSSLGYAYYYFIGCNTGTCPITSNPANSMVYGTIMGLIIFWPVKNKKEKS
ncbi:MAG: hypothetical protein HOA15_05345 [Candidatus Marinimicrobia bacterium]|jgi:hypothetical protein|nr:hypothetical protein [Candidatus Neomarinimicrobiota bacterium]MBT3676990.1 hypothetical protein [Candidatus Neomarinimicrobiota bacterium]MBT3763851.1 hypothetical protein [Candidatus Neomarinimicrobiota bacterium]MBT4068784.1 hypothetical protein [Candidatus Neomarinimicrobiota bacterium]MBT4270073.1 hypothetical protein [Candidatus Neomarinimicrobiota bacterium]